MLIINLACSVIILSGVVLKLNDMSSHTRNSIRLSMIGAGSAAIWNIMGVLHGQDTMPAIALLMVSISIFMLTDLRRYRLTQERVNERM